MPATTKQLMAALVPVLKDDEQTLGPTKKNPNAEAAMSPIGGDSLFYTYLVPGAVFQSKDGEYWDVENVADTGYIRIRNKYYPRQEATRHSSEIRKSIHAWVEPIQQIVPELVWADSK